MQQLRSSVAYDATPDATDDQYAALIAAHNAFAIDLLQQLMPPDQNFVFSPTSAYLTLGMAYVGASGVTAEEMRTVLHDSLPAGVFHQAANRLMSDLQASNADTFKQADGDKFVRVALADGIWADQTLPINSVFLDLLSAQYDAGVYQADFVAAAENARADINSWVSDKTSDNVRNLFLPGTIGPTTRWVLVNALAVNASWQTAFDSSLSEITPFSDLSGARIDVSTLKGPMDVRFYGSAEMVVLELPMVLQNLSMTLLVPQQGQFDTVRQRLATIVANQELAQLASQRFAVALPQFSIHNSSISLRDGLVALGMQYSFSDTADFSNITGQVGLNIGDFVQQSAIGVDASGVLTNLPTSPQDPGSLAAALAVDRPFIFLVRNAWGAILLAGQVVNPNQ